MKWNTILIRYGELSLKGKNRKSFVRKLKENIKSALNELSTVTLSAERDRMFLYAETKEDMDRAIQILPSVFGIQSFSPIAVCEPSIEPIKETALQVLAMDDLTGKTFKVEVKRGDKSFPYVTGEIQQMLGAHVLRNFQELKVQMKKPDVLLHIEIQKDAAYISSAVYPGAGGMPVGSNGHSLLLMSGGIDSPVAGYLMMKRGVSFDAIHFASPPFTSEQAKQKVEDLSMKLNAFGTHIKLHVIPFTDLQQAIVQQVPNNLSMTTTRRIMLQIADRVRKEIGALGLITGESLGQVASQTLESLTAINDVTSTPVMRPLIAMDKLEIIKIAQQIDTYDISIRPYEDCCTIFTPSSPKTKPQLEKVKHYEGFLDFEEMIEAAIRNRTVIIPGQSEQDNEFDELL